VRDIIWLRPDGGEMTDEEWNADWTRALGVCLAGDALDEVDEEGRRLIDDTLLLLLNAHDAEVEFQLPPGAGGRTWLHLVDTAHPDTQPGPARLEPGERGPFYRLLPRSVALLSTPAA
jgi:glycogen operon protein